MLGKRLAVGSVVILTGVVVGGALIGYAAAVPEGAKYVGTAKCRLCHLKQYKTWQKTKHADNFNVLLGPERKDPDCVRCHVTGFGEPGGFVSEDETPGLKNVGCESCHGPGSAHIEAAKDAQKPGGPDQWNTKINRVPQNACVECHNPHISQKRRAEELRRGREAGD